MAERFIPSGGWGPDGRRAALTISFDNLGEAADLEMGTWDGSAVGFHHTAAFVSKLIDVLGDVRATYFIEASNAAIYPDSIKAWNEAGQEVGIHAWRHENWQACAPDRRRALLSQSLAAMRSIGVEPVGFRPPGGAIPIEAWHEFAEAGLLYCSELDTPGIGQVAGVISVPFEWRAVDVYMIEDVMAFMRKQLGDPEAPFQIEAWRATLEAELADAVAEGGHRTVIFHPHFLGQSEEKLGVLRDLINAAKSQDVWIAPGRDVARFAADRMLAAQYVA